MMDFETVIGLEVHSQLLTRSKMFCSCAADYAAAPPNTRVCPVCLGMPGVLPVINRQAVEYTILTALALHCTISGYTKFDRKNYPYPDLMKGYQISQYDAPIATGGSLDAEADVSARVGIQRVHLEEDVAKLLHRPGVSESYSLVDVNRSGVPLMEIVSQPDLRSPEQARQYLIKLRTILQYLGVSTGNMEAGSFRCDANISLRPPGAPLPRAKVEVKNMNSFRAVFQALSYEELRLRELLEGGRELMSETRGWVEERGVTVLQRTKEYAHDYRYFPEPDLPPMELSPAWVEEVRARLPELPDSRRRRYTSELGLSEYDAGLITQSRPLGDFFEEALKADSPLPLPERAKKVANWLLGDFTRLLNATGMDISQVPVKPAHLMELVDLMETGRLSGPAAKQVLEQMFRFPLETAPGGPLVMGLYGRITVDRQPVADGTTLIALIDGTEVARSLVSGSSYRMLLAQPPGASYLNKTVRFKLGALTATESWIWQPGTNHRLDLTVATATTPEVEVREALASIRGKFTIVWGFDPATQTWRLYDATSPEVSDLKELVRGHGYWLYMVEDAPLLFGGNSYQLKQGWNLIGWLGKAPAKIVAEEGLEQIGGGGELEAAVAQVLQANPQAVADYRKGKGQAITFLVGQVMRASRGRANPQQAREVIIKKLEASV